MVFCIGYTDRTECTLFSLQFKIIHCRLEYLKLKIIHFAKYISFTRKTHYGLILANNQLTLNMQTAVKD